MVGSINVVVQGGTPEGRHAFADALAQELTGDPMLREVDHKLAGDFFVEGNGDVTLDDIAEYTRLDRRVLRHHLNVLCKEGRLERIGVGRHAIYSGVA